MNRNSAIRFIGQMLILMSFAGMVYAYTSSNSTRSLGFIDCPPMPYDIEMDLSSFTPEQQAALQKFLDNLNYQGFKEVYLRFCNYIDSINDRVGCDMVLTDTIQACNWPDTCDVSDPWYEGATPTVTINAAVLQLLAKPIDNVHSVDACEPTANEKYLSAPYLRFRGEGGDSLDLSFIGTLDSTESPHHQLYYLPDAGLSGHIMWTFTSDYDTTGANRRVYLGTPRPYTGLTQSGLIRGVNTSMTRDTIVFATKYSTRHGGQAEEGSAAFCHWRPGAAANNRYYRSGFAYYIPGTNLKDYTIHVQWADSSGAYFQDSLWIESHTDTSFVIGIEWSTTRRRLSWTTHGDFLKDFY